MDLVTLFTSIVSIFSTTRAYMRRESSTYLWSTRSFHHSTRSRHREASAPSQTRRSRPCTLSKQHQLLAHPRRDKNAPVKVLTCLLFFCGSPIFFGSIVEVIDVVRILCNCETTRYLCLSSSSSFALSNSVSELDLTSSEFALTKFFPLEGELGEEGEVGLVMVRSRNASGPLCL